MRKMQVLGTGHYVPDRIVENSYFRDELKLDTSDEWIRGRVGVVQRRFVAAEQATSDLATEAALRALKNARLEAKDINLIIVSTVSPDMFVPSTACIVQRNLGAKNAAAFDLNGSCSGFVYALETASLFLQNPEMSKILVIGADASTRLIDFKDRSTCVFFGDGAGAIIIGRTEESRGILASSLHTYGAPELVNVPAGGSRQRFSEEGAYFLRMDGRAVWNFAVEELPRMVQEVMAKAKMNVNEIDLLIPHQANSNIIDDSLTKLGLPVQRAFMNIHKYGNTMSASIPLAFNEAMEQGLCRPGKIVFLAGFGAGLTSGGILLRM